MRFTTKLGSLSAGGVLAGMMLATGCAVHAGYYYDPYDHRYYAPAQEDTYILTWENETHREHRDFRHRRDDERREYWQWREHHRDHDHDHDRDHDRH